MRAIRQNQVAHFVPKTDIVSGEGGGFGTPQLNFNTYFVNGLRVPVTVVSRAGLRVQIKANRTSRTGVFVGFMEKEFSASVILDTNDLLSDCGAQPSALARQIEQVLSQYHHRPLTAQPTRRLNIKHEITLEDLQANGGSVYVPPLDIVVSVRDMEFAPDHPFSMQAMRENMIDPLTQHSSGLHYHIRIVDRAGVFGGRFINLNGEVFAVPVVTEGLYQDGVYVISTHPLSDEGAFPYARADYYTFDDAKKLPLYLTAVEAGTLGEPQSALKRALDREKHDLAMAQEDAKRQRFNSEREFEMLKRQFETDREEAKAKHSAREEAIKERELILEAMEKEAKIRAEGLRRETMVEEEYQKRRNMKAKMTMELLKFGPSIVVGVWGIYKAIQKIREKK